jgi:PhzF family phenazine biosynthesis protein
LYQVDAFTDHPFSGNPAAVCLLTEDLPYDTMRSIAAEMNLSETAFVGPADQGGVRTLRWFTPAVEVPLCGHATLATSHVLLREVGVEGPLQFQTLSGRLTVWEEEDGWLRMDFPDDPPEPAPAPPGLLEALGCSTNAKTAAGVKLWVVELPTQNDVLAVKPDMGALAAVDLGETALGVSVTAPGDGDVDFVSRFFGPWVGVDEDPVTGMAHTVLGPYWMDILESENLNARQVSPRGGTLRVRWEGDRIQVSGRAVTVVRGTLVV